MGFNVLRTECKDLLEGWRKKASTLRYCFLVIFLCHQLMPVSLHLLCFYDHLHNGLPVILFEMGFLFAYVALTTVSSKIAADMMNVCAVFMSRYHQRQYFGIKANRHR